jgi:hypothetical protein
MMSTSNRLSWLLPAALACALQTVTAPVIWGYEPSRALPLPSDIKVAQGPAGQTGSEEEAPIPAPDFDPREAPPAPRTEAEPTVEEVEEAEEAEEEPWTLFSQEHAFKVHGWIEGGITGNSRKTTDGFNGPVTFNDRRDEFMLNQLYAVIERELDTEDGWDFGGRVDLLFGTDYIFTQAAGLETYRDFSPKWNNRRFYGLAMPQMYLATGYGDLSVKLGHFYTILGYEVVTAPDNFFYSHALTMQYGEPFTHTGGLATWNRDEHWTFTAGLVDGWDKFDPLSSRAHFLGGASYTPDEKSSLVFAVITGEEDGSNLPVMGNRTLYTILYSYNISEDYQYVIEHDYGVQSGAPQGTWEWYGINQYLFYTINDCWKAGLRGEWFRDDDGARIAAVRKSNPTSPGGYSGNFFELTAGLNWLPTANIVVRPEIRWDWFDGDGAPYDGRKSMLTFGTDVVMTW